MINIITSSRYKINRKQIKESTAELLSNNGFGNDHVLNIVFVGKNKMRTIAQKYKKENEALPVLSFAYNPHPVYQSASNNSDDSGKLIGEIFICYPQAVLLAAQREKVVDATMLNLIKHGVENILK